MAGGFPAMASRIIIFQNIQILITIHLQNQECTGLLKATCFCIEYNIRLQIEN